MPVKNDEKMCPLTKMTCYGENCAWWRHPGCCAISTIASSLHGCDLEIGRVTDELYLTRHSISELESRL